MLLYQDPVSSNLVIRPVSSVVEYAQVVKILGDGWVEAHCFDEKMRRCRIRGSMRKRVSQRQLIMSLISRLTLNGTIVATVYLRYIANG